MVMATFPRSIDVRFLLALGLILREDSSSQVRTLPYIRTVVLDLPARVAGRKDQVLYSMARGPRLGWFLPKALHVRSLSLSWRTFTRKETAAAVAHVEMAVVSLRVGSAVLVERRIVQVAFRLLDRCYGKQVV